MRRDGVRGPALLGEYASGVYPSGATQALDLLLLSEDHDPPSEGVLLLHLHRCRDRCASEQSDSCDWIEEDYARGDS